MTKTCEGNKQLPRHDEPDANTRLEAAQQPGVSA
jgi:hypothetical protein